MKRISLLVLFAAGLCLLSGCASRQPDAGVLLREARNGAEAMKSCSASIQQTLTFTADGKQHAFSSSNQIIYTAQPFALKSVQSVQNDGKQDGSETYTMTENGKLSFYCKTGGAWQKTDAGNLDTNPDVQVDILRLLNDTQDQKYVRETTLDSVKTHKIELKLNSEALRSAVGNIVTSTGMADNSQTVVQTLLNSAPPVYGYCYIAQDSGRILRIEADMTDAADQIFQKIDGGTVQVHVTKCEISGDISRIDSAPTVSLPADAKNASSVQAYG